MYRAQLREEEEGEAEEEMEDEVIMTTSKQPLPSPSSSSSSTKYIDFLGESFELQQEVYKPPAQQQQPSSSNFDHLVDLSLSSRIDDERDSARGGSNKKTEREHMFDKVVTPSDVGKLNRLVIPKQHAEKYFPLDTTTNEKGLLLNFEDRNGTQWRFRYSYWNSSQSYVMTKGWSRFVKEKKLDAGDIISFQREVIADDSGQQRLYIDWKRRPNGPSLNYPSTFTQFELQRFHNNSHWSRLYSPQLQHLNYNSSIQQYQGYNAQYQGYDAQYHYLRHQIGTFQSHQHHSPWPMVIDSVPIVHGKSVGKRLRLFGVNMDCCPIQQGDHHNLGSSSTVIPTSTMQSHEVSKKVKNSLTSDLDL